MTSGPSVRDNVARVKERIAAVCARHGRDPASVRLVAVTKKIPLPLVVEGCRCGLRDLGENRIPDALDRIPALPPLLAAAGLDPDLVRWHFIGHLQRNKAAKAAGRFVLLHGVDSLDLAGRLGGRARAEGRSERVLLEVNISGEDQKNGIAPVIAVETVAAAAEIPGLEILGLMGMARYDAPEPELHASFALLRALADKARSATGLPLPELSMGMSGDFEAAIAEGATLVRIGTALFGPRTDG
ncbi:MAG: YggS family pyridoxal phosphate-dependent enzyme [Candidatus Krumholzibacteriia bacterium]